MFKGDFCSILIPKPLKSITRIPSHSIFRSHAGDDGCLQGVSKERPMLCCYSLTAIYSLTHSINIWCIFGTLNRNVLSPVLVKKNKIEHFRVSIRVPYGPLGIVHKYSKRNILTLDLQDVGQRLKVC